MPNEGFSASNNRGIELTSAPFVLLLNPDAVLGEGALDALLESAERNPRAGIIGPAILNPDGSAQAVLVGPLPVAVVVSLAARVALRASACAATASSRPGSPRTPRRSTG